MIYVNIASLTGQLIYGILYLTMLYLLNLLTALNLVWIITGKIKRLFIIFNRIIAKIMCIISVFERQS